jgi:allantoate deiminase
MSNTDLAQSVMERIDVLAQISDEQDSLTRPFGSLAMRRANHLVGGWMREAGMSVSEDAIGNLTGRYSGRNDRAKTFLLGSHLDTVRHAGKFDGALGVLAAVACVRQLNESRTQLPFAVEVISFAGEEGARYPNTRLGSRVMTGKFDEKELDQVDAKGISLAEAIRNFGGDPAKVKTSRRDPREFLGYAEIHIEQGPVLERKFQPVGLVSAIAGQTRVSARFTGQAGHAGATPMAFRRDALAAAAQFMAAVETTARNEAGLVATVGQIEARPGAGNVIPGEVTLTLEVRHQLDSTRTSAAARLQELAQQICEKRSIALDWEVKREAQSVPCSRELSALLGKAARRQLVEVTELPSGADQSAAIMGDIMPVVMLFVRTHLPDESATAGDIGVAITVMSDFLQLLAGQDTPAKAKQK